MKPITISAVGATPDHGFDEPLGLLSDCHRRIERFLGGMSVIASRLRGGPLDEGNRKALEQAIAYFATSGPRHTADEEESLFPRLRASSDSRAASARETLRGLEADHRDAERRHAEVERLVRRWIQDDMLPPGDTDLLRSHLDALASTYERHIHVEDHDLFPAAAQVLSSEDIEKVGREMAQRRGVPFRPPEILRGAARKAR